MASELQVTTLRGNPTGANANKILVPTGQTLTAPGHVIQTQHAALSSIITVSSTAAYTDILSCSITTLHANSKIMIQAVIPNYSNNPNGNTWTNSHYLKLHESGTGIVAAYEHPGPQTSMEFSQTSSVLHMTGAKSVGAYTYTITVKPTIGGDSHYFGRFVDGHNAYTQMIVQEIAQ